VTVNEINYLFKQFDKNSDGTLDKDEFKRIFCEFDFSDLSDKAGIFTL
jgi:Ca2+-binding EF-hand superfamily protein